MMMMMKIMMMKIMIILVFYDSYIINKTKKFNVKHHDLTSRQFSHDGYGGKDCVCVCQFVKNSVKRKNKTKKLNSLG